MGEGWGDFHFAPNRPRRGGVILGTTLGWLNDLPDSTMTYRVRSYSLVVESDRIFFITFKFTCRHLRDLQGYCVYTSGGFFLFFYFFFPFPLGSASPQSPLWTSRPWYLAFLWRTLPEDCGSSQIFVLETAYGMVAYGMKLTSILFFIKKWSVWSQNNMERMAAVCSPVIAGILNFHISGRPAKPFNEWIIQSVIILGMA